MRQDFDFVAFDDYARDMGELSDLSASVIASQKKEIAWLRRAIAAVIKKAGGEVEIPNPILDPDPNIETMKNEARDTVILKVRST